MATRRNRFVDFLTWVPQGAVLALLRTPELKAALAPVLARVGR